MVFFLELLSLFLLVANFIFIDYLIIFLWLENILEETFKSKDPALLDLQMRNPKQKDLYADLEDMTITVFGYEYTEML